MQAGSGAGWMGDHLVSALASGRVEAAVAKQYDTAASLECQVEGGVGG